ncbi:caspase family protein [Paenibacillus sp. FSL R7-0337]|uniref:caspase family protein n=1 Tax=Paenibacillus sp. FSL R7-0337 TaxID=1926588 RepID=UPI00096C0B51|nr:caspase family protein [Paenibacillus sp. FSL R7-0337]OMF96836.1 hypothetical protein BK147_11740 [Paenibacillus sp. FSL R7-0337]
MNNIKAFVVGVSDYTEINANNLPFCLLDMNNFSQAIKVGLHVQERDIIHLGKSFNGVVSVERFWEELKHFIAELEEQATIIFYFSGHGTSTNPHYLVLSDGFVKTQELIEVISKSRARNKVLFLDCCYSGNFSIEKSLKIDIEDSIDTFNGTGYAVLTSSNAQEPSYGDDIGSVFTNILCTAITNKFLSREGMLSLQDLQTWVKRALEIQTENNPNFPQHAIFRANMGGTIFFKTSDYTPYAREHYYLENNNFIIHSVDPLHNGSVKRYAAKVILKSMLKDEDIAKVTLEISRLLKHADIYKSEQQKYTYKNQKTNIVWVYVGFSEEDITNSNYYGIATWVDEKQNKDWWYRLSDKQQKIINNVHFKKNSLYTMLKKFMNENTISDIEAIEQLRQVRVQMLNTAESIIFAFNELNNHTISEDELFHIVTPLCPGLDKLFITLTDISLSSTNIKEYREAHISLLSTIHDFSLFYNEKYKDQRDSTNRKTVMKMTISRYYSDLRSLEKIEESLGLLK